MNENFKGGLEKCRLKSNCILVEWEFINLNQAYEKLIEICNHLPRTKLIEQNNYYWHGVCKSLIFRFPDDLEILKLPKEGIIQAKSCSRFGLSDLGVNKNRLNKIYKKLMNNNCLNAE